MFALAGFVAAAAGCGDDNNVPDAGKIDGTSIDADMRTNAQLAISPLTADFGATTAGSTSSTMTFTVTNSGQKPSSSISATLMGAGASNFSIVTNGCTTLAGGATCTITAAFSPTATATGNQSASLSVSATDGGAVSATLDGKANPPGSLTITPTSNAFADTVVGSTSASSATFTVTNPGGSATPALSVQASGSNPNDFVKSSDTCNGNTLAPAATCSIVVSFKPTSAGAKSASFTIAATGTNSVVANVTGNGISDAKLTVTPTLQDFGTVLIATTSNVVSFTVTNTGGVTSGTINQVLGGADASQFSIVSSSCSGATVAPAGTCTVGVRFAPTSAGAKAATLSFTGTPGGTSTATLLGTGQNPGQIKATPTTLAFADTTTGQTSASQTVTISNTGAAPTGALTTALAGNDPGQFSIVSGSNGCQGAILAPAASCTIAIAFAPTTGGAKSANLSVTGSPGGTTTVGLSGNGLPPAHLSIVPTSHDYGAVGVGSQTGFFTFTVTNDGSQTSGTPTAVLGGANATQFVLQNGCTAALAPNATCQVQVRFAPNIKQTDSATVTVSATPGGSATANLFGSGVDPAALQTSPSSTTVTFDGSDTSSNTSATLIGSTVTQTFTLINNGTEPTGTIMLSKSGPNAADFSFTSNCTSLPQNMTCTVTVTFVPTAAGTETATIVATASPGGTVSIPVSGTVLPKFSVAPTTADYGVAIVNTTAPVQKTFVFTNNTKTTQTVSAATPLADTTNYSVVANGCAGASLTAGGNCSIVVQFKPTTTGTKSTTLTASIGAGAVNTATANLTGAGVNSLTIDGTSQPANNINCTGAVGSRTCDFGSVPLNTSSSTLTATVTLPAGSPNANSISTSLSNTDFQIVQDNCAGASLSSGGTTSCTILVRLAPTGSAGARAANLTVTASPSGGSATLALTGTAVTGANLVINPSDTVDFGTIVSGTTVTKPITVTNNGGATAGPVTFSITSGGANYTLDPQAGDCATTVTALAPTASCTIHVKYSATGQSATTSAAQTGNLRIATNGAGITGNHDVLLTGKASPSITVTPALAALGDVAVGSTNNQSFTVTNNSSNGVTISSATVSGGGEATITSNTCSGTIAAGATCTIGVQFAPTASGTYDDTLTVTSANGLGVAHITARALTAANLAFTPATSPAAPADLGSALAGSANGGTQVFTLKNSGQTVGNVAIAVGGLNAGDFTQTNTCGATLAAGASCTVTVKFTPPVGETATAKTATISAGGGVNAYVTGTVQNTGNILITPSTASYADTVVGQTSTATTFTLVNSNSVAQNVALALAGTNPGDFTIVSNLCPVSLAAGASCTATVAFKPTATGFRQAQLSTAGGAPGFSYAALFGNGLGPASLSLIGKPTATGAQNCPVGLGNCTSYAYGSVATGDSNSEIFVVTNSGGVPSAALATSVDGNDPSQFKVSADTCNGTAVAAGASCSVTVSFAPTGVGAKSATFHVGAQSVALTGTGVLQSVLGITPSAPQTVADTAVGHSGPFVDFAIKNGGDVDTSTGLSISLSNTTDFTLGTAAASPCANGTKLAAGATCNVRVVFAPGTLGTDTTTLTVSGGAGPGTTTVTNTVTGKGTSTITVAPPSHDYGTVANATPSASFTFTFTNNGDGATGPLHTVLGGANPDQFSITSDMCTGNPLASGATCTIAARFTPQGTGAKTATITVAGAVGSPTATLSGTSN